MRRTIASWIFGKATEARMEGEFAFPKGKLFQDILVVLTGSIHDEQALDIGSAICKMEGAQLAGLFITEPRKKGADYRIGQINKEFEKRCLDTGTTADLAVGFARDPAPVILRRSHFADLTIIALPVRNIHHFNLSNLVHHCATPLLIVKNKEPHIFSKWILVVDGSVKSREALSMTAYAAQFWDVDPVVLSIETNKTRAGFPLLDPCNYLGQYHVDAEYIKASGPTEIASILIDIEAQCSLIVIGEYNSGRLGLQLSGSIVDDVIRRSSRSVLICKQPRQSLMPRKLKNVT